MENTWEDYGNRVKWTGIIIEGQDGNRVEYPVRLVKKILREACGAYGFLADVLLFDLSDDEFNDINRKRLKGNYLFWSGWVGEVFINHGMITAARSIQDDGSYRKASVFRYNNGKAENVLPITSYEYANGGYYVMAVECA